ncbi:hypothetical protein ACUHMQ_16660 [Chitinimonas sp. PSY-7]|uniref:hypothetical protein n=1 Tax=Chitinimonas sp. PSY-7 TaxID=3459088 RepID=UPI004040317D
MKLEDKIALDAKIRNALSVASEASAKELAEALQLPMETVAATLHRMAKERILTCIKNPGFPILYTLSPKSVF